ncbi:MAG: serine protease, partial [Nitrospirae bacterium]|nr:serine protease [Nitrospirota bacterium]
THAAAPDDRLATAVERARRATVGILAQTPEAQTSVDPSRIEIRGTGVHLRDGYIVTARHVAEREEQGRAVISEQILILTADLHELPARLTGVNTFLDLAVYRVDGDSRAGLASATPFAEKEPDPGEEVFTVGYPLGWGPAVAYGRIGNPKTFLPTVETRLLQADVSVCSGNSGGGLFNARGEMVGVVHAVIQTEQIQGERRCSRFAFAVPGVLAQRIVTALIQGTQVSFSRLGIRIANVKVGTRWRASVADASGPALAGGVQKGDLLLAIDDTEIRDAAQLKNYLIERTVPGQQVTLRVLRGDREVQLPVTLGRS